MVMIVETLDSPFPSKVPLGVSVDDKFVQGSMYYLFYYSVILIFHLRFKYPNSQQECDTYRDCVDSTEKVVETYNPVELYGAIGY